MKNKKEIDMIVGVIISHAIADDGANLGLTLCEGAFEKVANQILTKLQTLDRDRVKEIIKDAWDNRRFGIGDIEEIINKNVIEAICQLIPEEGIVIAEGEVEILGWGYVRVGEEYVEDLLKKYENKKGKLIFIEDKEE